MESGNRVVKVRVNASGRRIIGIVAYDPLYPRFSDFLNCVDRFLPVKRERATVEVNKEAISYLEALEEHPGEYRPAAGGFRRVQIELRAGQGVIEGEVFLPEDADVGDLLSDGRLFLSVRGVTFQGAVEHYAFLAVPKAAILVLVVPEP